MAGAMDNRDNDDREQWWGCQCGIRGCNNTTMNGGDNDNKCRATTTTTTNAGDDPTHATNARVGSFF